MIFAQTSLSRIDELEEENSKLRARIEEFYGDDAATLRARVAEQKLRLEVLTKEGVDLRAEAETIKSNYARQIENTREFLDENVFLRAEVERLDRLVKDKMGKNSTLRARIAELEGVAQALIGNVRQRYPGEELRCPYMIALDAALAQGDDDDPIYAKGSARNPEGDKP